MLFKQLVHQPTGLLQLRQMAAADRLPHANLLLAPAGTGGLAAALALSTYILCEQRGATDACGQCRSCRKALQYAHPDWHFSFPTIGAKMISDHFLPQWRKALADNPYMEANDWLQQLDAENKQGNITKDECGAIMRKLNLKSFESPYKIMLIWLPEFLGNEGNRLLKMIEEPPEGTIFLLVAEKANLLLNTIISRCQLTKLMPPSSSEISSALVARGAEEKAANSAARLADSNFNQALQLSKERDDSHEDLFVVWMRACHQGSAAKLVPWTNEFAKLGRENQKKFLHYCLHFWRELLLLSVQEGGIEGVRLLPSELSLAQKMRALVDLEQLEQISLVLNDCIEAIERNAHPKILLLDASLRLHYILRKAAIATSA